MGEPLKTREEYHPGRRVRGEVYRILPQFGILLRLEDGTHAFIRRRELTWSKAEPDPRDFARVGDWLDAVTLQRDSETGNLSLSLRLLERDPWQGIAEKYPVGSQVAGTVVQLASFGAFVEIGAGIRGLIPLAEIDPEKEIQSVDEALWIGDHVQALVARVEPDKRRLSLSINALFVKQRVEKSSDAQTRRGTGTALAELLNGEVAAYLRKIATDVPTEPPPAEEPISPGKIPRILMIDDHAGFRVPIADWLEQIGYTVARAETAEQGIAFANHSAFDLILLDMHLPDTHGIEAARQLLAIQPDTPLLLISAYEISDDLLKEIEQLGVPLLYKPLDVADMRNLLRTVEKGDLPPSAAVAYRTDPGSSDLVWRSAEWLRVRQSLGSTLEKILTELERETRAGFTAILEMATKTLEVDVLAGTHLPRLDQGVRLGLQYSPIQDVIQYQQPLLENDVPGARRRFRHLLDWTNFGSCIGVPIPTLADEPKYALFLFHGKQHHFSDSDRDRAVVVAPLLGAAISRQEVETYLQESQKLMLLGQLGSGVLHEVFNRLGGAPFSLRNLSADLSKVIPTEARTVGLLGHIQESVSQLDNNVNAILDAIGLFRQVTRAEEYENVNVNASLRRAADLLYPIAQKNAVKIEWRLDDALPQTRSIGVRLDQVFLNVLLNAIQWTASRPAAKIIISTAFRKDSELPIKVRLQDTGPGIHQQNYEKVYGLGFTTTKGGTGVGLFLAKGLIESVGGHIRIEESTMFLGTTFLIELPFRPQQEGKHG